MDSVFWALEVAVRWVRLKIYQYEVTFAVYMLTPTEKFIFSKPALPLLLSCLYSDSIFNGRLPPLFPHHDACYRRLRLPPRSRQGNLWSPLLLLGRGASFHSNRYSACKLGARDRLPDLGDYVRDGEERGYDDNETHCLN